jgi:hypothetical protein
VNGDPRVGRRGAGAPVGRRVVGRWWASMRGARPRHHTKADEKDDACQIAEADGGVAHDLVGPLCKLLGLDLVLQTRGLGAL